MRRRRGSGAGVFLLFLLTAAACAVGVEVDPARLPRPRDGGLGDGKGGSTTVSSGGFGGSPGAGGSGGTGGSPASGGGGNGGSGGTGSVDSGKVEAGSGGTGNGDSGFDGPIAIDSSSGCIPTQKSCGGRCVIPEARVGCALVGCDPCLPPAHSIAHCTGMQCDFSCLSGFERSGDICIPSEGGAGGTGGSNDGGPMHCVASQCGGCIPYIQIPCCKADDSCGCMYPFAPCN